MAAGVMTRSAGVTGPIRWAALNRALDGEIVSGDGHVVVPTEEGALVALIDGLGHGPEAALAANEAARELERDPTRSVVQALEGCHRALSRTRGAVMSIVRVSRDEVSWVGVGNVDAVVVRGLGGTAGRARLLPVGGVVGHKLPTLRLTVTPIARGDMLVLATDGLRFDVMDHIDAFAAPEAVVDRMMSISRTGRDDALALAARYDGAPW